MRNSARASLVVSALVLSLAPMMLPVHAASGSLPLQLGYGLTTLTPVSSGTPVYTVGDTMWVLSNFSEPSLATLVLPNSSAATRPAENKVLQPGIPLPLHEFVPSDPEGVWSLRLAQGGLRYHLSVNFVKPAVHQPTLGISQYSLRNDKVLIGFRFDSVDAYDQEACLVSATTENLAVVHLPRSVGVGDMVVKRSGNNITLVTHASFNSSFAFWLELYHPFSFNMNGTASFASTSLRAASTTPVTISSEGNSSAVLNWETSQRTGRYEARAFFQTPAGLFVEQARFLIIDRGTWMSLDSCQLQRVGSASISFLASLSGDPDTWPSSMYLMYRVSGVESTSRLALPLNISKVSFIAREWNATVDNPRITVLPNDNLQQYTLVNGSLYLISKSYPMFLRYLVPATSEFSGQAFVTLPGPYKAFNSPLVIGKLLVHVLNQESPSAGAQIELSDGSNRTVVETTNISAYAAFFVNGGNYTVTAMQGKESRTYRVTVSDEQETDLEVQLPAASVVSQPMDSTQNILIATGMIAVALNVLVWFVRPRLSR